MSISKSVVYHCDSELYCSSEWSSGHGLPNGWFALTYADQGGKQTHLHFCSVRCLLSAASWAWGAKQIVSAVETAPMDFWDRIPEWPGQGQ